MKTTARDAYGNVLGTTGPITWLGTLIDYVDAVGGGWYRLVLSNGGTASVTRTEFAANAKAA